VVLAKSSAGQWCLVTSASTRCCSASFVFAQLVMASWMLSRCRHHWCCACRPTTEVIAIDLGTGLLAKNKDKYTDEVRRAASSGSPACALWQWRTATEIPVPALDRKTFQASPSLHSNLLRLPCLHAGLQASALSKLRLQGYDVAMRGCALLGYVAAGGTAGVLLATRVRKKCTLPGGHAVFLVVDSQWVLIPLQVRLGAAF
jgi:hypothetical protein